VISTAIQKSCQGKQLFYKSFMRIAVIVWCISAGIWLWSPSHLSKGTWI